MDYDLGHSCSEAEELACMTAAFFSDPRGQRYEKCRAT